MKAQLTLVPKLSIHPNKINIFNELHWDPAKPHKDKSQLSLKYIVDENGNLIEDDNEKIKHIIKSDRKAHGKVSNNARKKMDKAADYLLMMAGEKSVTSQYTGRTFKFKIAFITLTLPSSQIHDDKKIINNCLNQFIIEIKKRYQVRNYIWRAEKQKNGNIHFHILVDKYIYWQELRDRWNRIINKLDYVNRYREQQQDWHKKGFKVRKELLPTWPIEKQKQAYKRGAQTHWASPNTTDIHSIKKIRNVKQYISKYMTKQPYEELKQKIEKLEDIRNNNPDALKKVKPKQREKLLKARRKRQIQLKKLKQTGRIWGCNRELSNITGARAEVDSSISDELNLLLEAENVYKYEGHYFTVIYLDYRELQLNNMQGLFQLFSRYMFSQFGFPIQAAMSPA